MLAPTPARDAKPAAAATTTTTVTHPDGTTICVSTVCAAKAPFTQSYPIGVAGVPWGAAERAEWLTTQSPKRSYREEVLDKLQPFKARFDVVQYGALKYLDAERYPLFAVKSKNWAAAKPRVLVTGGVHGYETSGVQGALLFLETKAEEYSKHFNIVVLPCVSPWGYECIQRWNAIAEDPNRAFRPERPAEESAAVMNFVASLGGEFLAHVDLHETTDTDESEYCPAKAARDGLEYVPDEIPDGFYAVGDTDLPQAAWHKAIIDAVRKVTHIAPPDKAGNIIGEPITQEGVIVVPSRKLFLCSSVTNASFATTTEVYPDSPAAGCTPEQCNLAQVAAVVGALDYLIAHPP